MSKETMLAKVMKECNNHFMANYRTGIYQIHENVLTVAPTPLKGTYVRVYGSFLNDGIYKVESVAGNSIMLGEMQNERFHGAFCYLRPDPEFLEVVELITEYQEYIKTLNEAGKIDNSLPLGTLESESFEGYSFKLTSRLGGTNGVKGSNPLSWQQFFAQDLNPYLRMFDDRVVI